MINILGVDLESDLKMKDLSVKIKQFLASDRPRYIVTPNPEIVLQAQKDEELFCILGRADLSLADGFGLKIAAALCGRSLSRITGADALLEILKVAESMEKKVLFINNRQGLSSATEITAALNRRWPDLKFLVEDCDLDFTIPTEKKLLDLKLEGNSFWVKILKKAQRGINQRFSFLVSDQLLDFSADILICNFGAPYQEKFIYHNLNKLPHLRLAIGIGGALDFLSGKISRAPKIMRQMGLEWLWRLIKQPQRYRRIYRAVFVFMFKFLKWRFINPFLYRPNVACFLYKKFIPEYSALSNKTRSELENYLVLLVERSEDPGHWQLPQGGLDSDSIKLAGSRELYEELGLINFSPQRIYPKVYKYRTGHSGRYGYRGQRQSLLLAEFHGSDSDIRLNYWDHSAWKWVKASELLNQVHPIRRDSGRIFLEKFKDYLNLK